MKLQTLQKSDVIVPSFEEDEEVERDIASVLLFSGYEPDTSEWTSAMLHWKRRRASNPRAYKKFMGLD